MSKKEKLIKEKENVPDEEYAQKYIKMIAVASGVKNFDFNNLTDGQKRLAVNVGEVINKIYNDGFTDGYDERDNQA